MPAPTRRRRLRAEMSEAIVRAAVAQVRADGADGLSLNAIGRELGTSGPALYRYFPSREALLAAVAAWGYADLAERLEAAANDARGRPPADRFRAVAAAYRSWALDERELFGVVFGSRAGSGAIAPERLRPAATRAMEALLSELADIMPPGNGERAAAVPSPALAKELQRWSAARDMVARDPAVLLRGLRAWTRLHGVVSLELQGAWAQMELDAARVFEAEVDSVLDG